MPYCRSCGAQIPDEASFCPECGAPVVLAYAQAGSQTSQNEFDRLTRDSRTQEHWFRRLIAYLIDSVIVGIGVLIITGIIALITGLTAVILTAHPSAFFIPIGPFSSGIFGLSGLLFLLYFTILEGTYHKTVGKSLMGLYVTTLNYQPVTLEKAFIRNLSKIYWVLLLLDVLAGLFTEVHPGQKFSDKIANTIVISRKDNF